MLKVSLFFLTLLIAALPLQAQSVGGSISNPPASTPPSGAAGGVLSGTYPNPGFASQPSVVLAVSGTQVSHTGNTNETVLATVTVPAGVIGPNGRLRVNTLWTNTGNGNNKSFRVRFGGIGGTAYSNFTVTTQTASSDQRDIINANSASVQKGQTPAAAGGLGSGTAALLSGSVDTTASTTLVFTVQLANASDTGSLEGFSVILIPGN